MENHEYDIDDRSHTILPKRKRTAAQAAAEKRYAAAHVKIVSLKLNDRTDADILAKLDEVDNIRAYIKSCIRADLAK